MKLCRLLKLVSLSSFYLMKEKVVRQVPVLTAVNRNEAVFIFGVLKNSSFDDLINTIPFFRNAGYFDSAIAFGCRSRIGRKLHSHIFDCVSSPTTKHYAPLASFLFPCIRFGFLCSRFHRSILKSVCLLGDGATPAPAKAAPNRQTTPRRRIP